MKRENVEAYLDPFGLQIDAHIQRLYTDRFINFVRFVPSSSSSSSSAFFTASISAEMKKRVNYKVDVKVDQHGVVEECQCECASGMGPSATCKHVQVTLLGLTKQKEGILTHQTCTQQLQTFHKVKQHTGSPG